MRGQGALLGCLALSLTAMVLVIRSDLGRPALDRFAPESERRYVPHTQSEGRTPFANDRTRVPLPLEEDTRDSNR